jgi:hypothetical protein
MLSTSRYVGTTTVTFGLSNASESAGRGKEATVMLRNIVIYDRPRENRIWRPYRGSRKFKARPNPITQEGGRCSDLGCVGADVDRCDALALLLYFPG